MRIDQENGLTIYRFEQLARFEQLQHGIFARGGGASRPPFDGLNTAYSVGDDPQCVAENRQRVAGCFPGTDVVYVSQVHGTAVHIVAAEDHPPTAVQADALVSRSSGRLLAIQVADCQAVLLFDPVRGVAANVHAGWRGSIANVVAQTVGVMQRRFGCRPQDLHAGIGPSLGPCCAEFVNYKAEIPRPFWRYGNARNLFDFWAITADQLVQCGVPPAAIETSRICTKCRTDAFFSYRGQKQTGRFVAVIGLGADG